MPAPLLLWPSRHAPATGMQSISQMEASSFIATTVMKRSDIPYTATSTTNSSLLINTRGLLGLQDSSQVCNSNENSDLLLLLVFGSCYGMLITEIGTRGLSCLVVTVSASPSSSSSSSSLQSILILSTWSCLGQGLDLAALLLQCSLFTRLHATSKARCLAISSP